MKLAKKLILLFKDEEGFGVGIAESLQPKPGSDLQKQEDSFQLSLEKYGIKDHEASGKIIHFLSTNGAYEVSVLILENYEPPILACALNEVLALLVGEKSSDIPTLIAPFLVATSKLKMENKSSIASHGVSIYGVQFGPATNLTQALDSKVQKPPPSLQIYQEQLACLLQFVRVLKMPAFVIFGQIGQHTSPRTSKEDLEIIYDVGELLASNTSLDFLRERIAWNPTKSSRASEEPWCALYG